MAEEPRFGKRRYIAFEIGLLQADAIMAYIDAHPPQPPMSGQPDQQYREKVADYNRIKTDLEKLKP